MNKLIEHVARSSKFDRAHELDAVESIAASPMIHDLIEEYAENQRFILNIEDELFFIANQEILTVIFENLISNAYKYADTASPIMINMGSATESNQVTGESDKFIYFAISNMAGRHGVPDEKRLFERYYRHSHAQSVSGLGIGLSLVKAAAKKIHASVNYRYEDGRITFTVRIPN
jgi:signal transduction histidine kinase